MSIMTKEFIQNNMSNLLEDIRRNCISINLGVVDTMWVCDVMNNEKMGNLIPFVYESPQCNTPVDALYDSYTWLIKNGKIELEIDSGKEEYSYDSFWLSDYRSEGSSIRYSDYKVRGFRFCTESSTADITIEIIL